MRKTDEELRQNERPMQHLVAVCLILVVIGALAAFGLWDNLMRMIGR